GGTAGPFHERGQPRVAEVVVVLVAAGQRDSGQQGGRVGVVAVVDRDEPVDALAGGRAGEEVDVVGRGDRLEHDLEPDRLGRLLVRAGDGGDVGQLAG